MAEKKQGLFDLGIQALRYLLAERPKDDKAAPAAPLQPVGKTLEDIKLDELNHEQVRLDQAKRKMLQEVRDLENAKRKYFEEGVKNASERERVALAREIKSLDLRAQNKDRMLQSLEKQRQIIDGLIMLKERTAMLKESGLASVIGQIDLSELITYVNTASVDGEFTMNKFDDVLRTLGQADAFSPRVNEDTDVLEILRQMDAARNQQDSPDAIEEHFKDLNRTMAERNKENEAPEEELF